MVWPQPSQVSLVIGNRAELFSKRIFNAANVEYVVDIKRANLLHESPGTDPDEQLLYNYGPLVMDCALPHLD